MTGDDTKGVAWTVFPIVMNPLLPIMRGYKTVHSERDKAFCGYFSHVKL